MNYLAHGWRFTGEPYFLAGTAAPDWLSVIDRKTRLRSRTAAEFVADADPIVASIARGVIQHHADDAARLLIRLNHILRRVNLSQLPSSLLSLLPSMRSRVRDRMPDLLNQSSIALAGIKPGPDRP